MPTAASEPSSPLDLLRRTEERDAARDSIGNFEPQHCARRWDASLYRPVADEMLHVEFPRWRDTIT